MDLPNSIEISRFIFQRLEASQKELIQQYKESKDKIAYFFIDEVLPVDLAQRIAEVFPKVESLYRKSSLKESKYVSAQMDKYHSLLEIVLFAFQDERVVNSISKITGIPDLMPDKNLYAGGLSSMGQHDFLQPHLDNSHDKDRNNYRVLNLLYYVSPSWQKEFGGNLELWPDGLKGEPIEIPSRFNRLVVMATHKKSWHSVSQVTVNKCRNCISNYYFSEKPLDNNTEFHITTFRGRPGQLLKDKILRVDSFLRMGIRKVFKKGIVENPHYYKNREDKNKF